MSLLYTLTKLLSQSRVVRDLRSGDGTMSTIPHVICMAVVTVFSVFSMRAEAANLTNTFLGVIGENSRLRCTGPQLLDYTDGIYAGLLV